MLIPAGWQEYPVYRQGAKVGSIITKDSEIHCMRDESAKGKWLSRTDLKNTILPIIKQYGFATTKVRLLNNAGHRFVTRIGFSPAGSDLKNIIYRIERLHHARD